MGDRHLIMWASLGDIEQIFGLEPAPTEHPVDPRRNLLLLGKIKSDTPALGLWVQVAAVVTLEKQQVLPAQTEQIAQLIRWEFIKSAMIVEGSQPTVDTALALRPEGIGHRS